VVTQIGHKEYREKNGLKGHKETPAGDENILCLVMVMQG
jgi:hypothetical protein